MIDPAPLLRRLAGRRLLARAAILFEAFGRHFGRRWR